VKPIATRPSPGIGWTLVWIAVIALQQGCSSMRSCRSGTDARGVACETLQARERLEFGMSRAVAMATLGSATVAAPWRTDLGSVPAEIQNPFDSQTIESALGESYEVVRFFVEVERVSKCPFLQGRIRFAPLIFFDDQLVGWKWSYVADLTGRPVEPEQMSSHFGVFCDQQRAEKQPQHVD